MRRLTSPIGDRLRDERGAVAVFVALAMVVLLAFAALAIDTAAARRDQQVLRNAADAAALAVALECAEALPFDRDASPATECPDAVEAGATTTARSLVADNAGAVGDVSTSLSGFTVTVTVTATYDRPVPIALGPGIIEVSATATWSPATIRFNAHHPLAISYCRYASLPATAPATLTDEPAGLWLLPPRQDVDPAAWNADDNCLGPDGTLGLPSNAMTPVDLGADCGTSSSRGSQLSGETWQRSILAERTCVASSQFGGVTGWPYGGHQIVVPVYDRVDGGRYRVWDYLGFHVMGVTEDGGVWGFSTGKADLAFSQAVPLSVRLTA